MTTPASENRGALAGIRIVDLTTVVLGPWASQTLGDMGAEVIKIETPEGDVSRKLGPARNPGMAALFMTTNRNKRSVVLDLNQPAARDALLRIIDTADVFLHNLRPKVATKLKLGYEHFAKRRPDLIYCAAYGFRAEGPLADKPAYDDVIQSASGLTELMSVLSDQPRFVPTIVADKTSAYNALSAVLAALFHRQRGGGGQAIEVPMYETLVDYLMVEHLYGAAFDPPIGKMGYERVLSRARRPYATRDGYLTVLPYSDDNWQSLFRLAGRDDLLADPDYATIATRTVNSEKAYGELASIIATRTTAEWVRDLEPLGVPVATVRRKEDLLEDEQLKASGFWHIVVHPTEGRIRMTDPPIRFEGSPSSIRRLAPRLGEHSAEVLAEAGYTKDEIEELFKQKASLAAT
ncbi:MAG: CaiB/BaiF CoA transferase family protein [Burkholderiales bacterium]